jgi:ATP-dependent exoDNAse (exonuclease V) alpha subunit
VRCRVRVRRPPAAVAPPARSFAGIGLGGESAELLATKAMSSRKTSDRWRVTKVLVVDEVSMMSAGLLDKLEYVARATRGTRERFGGVQVGGAALPCVPCACACVCVCLCVEGGLRRLVVAMTHC